MQQLQRIYDYLDAQRVTASDAMHPTANADYAALVWAQDIVSDAQAAVASSPVRDYTSHTEAINAANQPQESSPFRSHQPDCSFLKSGSEQGPHDCGPEQIVAPADLPAAIASRQPFVMKEGDKEMVVS